MELTGKQQRFCEEYVIDHNATQAYMRSGYSAASADAAAVQGHRLLRNPKILKRIEELREDLRNRSALTADMVTAELRKLGFWNIQDFLNAGNQLKDLTTLARNLTIPVAGIKSKTITYTNEEGRVITETTVELKMHDKRGALTDLGKHLGIFEKDNEQKGLKIKVTRTK